MIQKAKCSTFSNRKLIWKRLKIQMYGKECIRKYPLRIKHPISLELHAV